MKFADRPAAERVAIDAWIRVVIMARENACMKVADDFKRVREESISASPEGIPEMMRHYAAYQEAEHSVSYTQYFQVSNPEAYGALVLSERGQ